MSDQVDELRCAECGRQPRDDENAPDEWQAYLDVDDHLPVFCPQCAQREFKAYDAPLSRRVTGPLKECEAPRISATGGSRGSGAASRS